ncbi:DUF4148 domain-containing protein [Xenophilus arseniciresistens]|uniref:DUF4148 domain-containing protein n=1 Tax=Xenophilus arseniciresistens TaxID=1283306 RepID=A0AAE3NEL8_9BURK|nr:DUF4148 domain-containing protein [Xenophilus arseniciresistens]MDA7418199.1 DUF4148 domain-containing protein [Xenophilus arseniciresistens]
MKTSKIIAVAALSLMAAVGAQAEEYQGVLDFQGQLSRAEVRAQAVQAARVGDVYGETLSMGVQPVQTGAVSRAVVQAEAIATAHAPNQNLHPEAFADSRIPSQFGGATGYTQQAAR